MKVFRLHDCICCILHFFGHLSPLSGTKDRGYIQLELLCLWRYSLCFSLTHFYKKKVPGSTIKPNMCSFTFYFTWSMWLGTLVFSSSLRTYRKRFFCFVLFSGFLFLKLKLCMNYWTYFSGFPSLKYSGTLHWKLKTFLAPLCAFLFCQPCL